MSDRDYTKVVSASELATAKQALAENGFNVEVVENLAAAKARVLEIIPKGAEVFTASSVTLTNSGLDSALNNQNEYKSVREEFMPYYNQPDKAIEMRRIGSGSDYTVGSVQAVTQDGQVVIASASGSQLPNYVYGANHVIWLVGTHKIVKDLPEALDRIENHVLGLEDKRALKAYGAHSSLNKILIYRKETRERVTIIFVKEAVGY
jgi:hypothetical protein